VRLRRIPNPHGWTSIPNKAIEAPISFRAVGVLAFLLSRPDGWETDSVRMSKGEGREGRDAVRTALNELEGAKYLHRVKVRRPAGMTLDGRYVGGQISTEYFVSDHPVDHPGEVIELVDSLAVDEQKAADAWESVSGAETGENPVDAPGGNRDADAWKTDAGKSGVFNQYSEPLDPTSQGELTSGADAPVEKVAALGGALLPLAALDAAWPSGAPAPDLSSTDSIQAASRLEAGVQMFALRANLTELLGLQPTWEETYRWVERAHESAAPSSRGRLRTREVMAYAVAVCSPPEPDGSAVEPALAGGRASDAPKGARSRARHDRVRKG
jgi:hypothetical protein